MSDEVKMKVSNEHRTGGRWRQDLLVGSSCLPVRYLDPDALSLVPTLSRQIYASFLMHG